MKPIYIFGHRNPDTDSVCSSIALSYFKNEFGLNTIPATLGEINRETEFALNYFDVEKPKYINDVRLQISDIDYHKNLYMKENDSLYTAINMMSNNNVSGLPVVDDENKLTGMITMKEIATYIMNDSRNRLNTSYDNIVQALDGKELLKFDDNIDAEILLASLRSTNIINNVELNDHKILIVADRHSVIEYAVENNIKLLILVQNSWIKDEHLKIAEDNHINIIKTELNAFQVSKRINLANTADVILKNKTKKPTFFNNYDYVGEFRKEALKKGHTNYPIVDSKGICLGLLRMADLEKNEKKKVILVDHNEPKQSAIGLDEAEIIEIVDHHNIGNINTNSPINFRNMAVGSTASIVYRLYKENNIKVSKKVAGLLLSAILSDTLILKSPTTKEFDKQNVKELSKMLNIDYEKYGIEMYKAGANIKDKKPEDLILTDYKNYNINDTKISISQIQTLDIDEIKKNKDDFISSLNKIAKENNLKFTCLFVTDIIDSSSYMFYSDKANNILKDAFNLNDIYEGIKLEGYVSRKKQILPKILDVLE